MLDFFLTKVKGLFSSPTTAAQKPVAKKEVVKVTKETVKEVATNETDDKNRVVFSPTKPASQPVVQPAAQPSVSKEEIDRANAQAQAILQNAEKV